MTFLDLTKTMYLYTVKKAKEEKRQSHILTRLHEQHEIEQANF